MMPARIRLLARLGEGPVMELWRGGSRNHNVSQNSIIVITAELSHQWDVWVERPMRDADMIGRRATFDEDHIEIMEEIDTNDPVA